MEDDSLFDWDSEDDADEEEPRCVGESSAAWTLLIVDDEPEVHAVTKLALKNVEFDGRRLQFVSAFSGTQARGILSEPNRIALVLLDVIMEEDDAGLKLVEFIRHELANESVRIILRTGQPGQAPERDVITRYDINDYKAKTELTAAKLFTTVITGLRTYRNLIRIEANRVGLERMVRASASVFELRSLREFFGSLVTQLRSVFDVGESVVIVVRELDSPITKVLCATTTEGVEESAGDVDEVLDAAAAVLVEDAFEAGEHIHRGTSHALYVPGRDRSLVLYLQAKSEDGGMSDKIVQLFCQNLSVAINNLTLHDELQELTTSLQRFVPESAMAIMGKSSVTQIEHGDFVEGEFCVFFLDIRRFTSLAEKMTPQEALAFINSFLGVVAPVVGKHHGVVDKYLGDGFMAIFSRPDRAREDAIQCGIEILKNIQSYNGKVQESSSETAVSNPVPVPEPIEVGIGIQAGPMILGAIGYDARLDFTVLGDVVNSASRIENLNKDLGTNLLVHENMLDGLELNLACRYVGAMEIRGKSERARLWEIYESDLPGIREEKQEGLVSFVGALQLLESGDRELGMAKMEKLAARYSQDSVLRYYLDQAEAL